MDDHEILQHLLNLESEAAALVDDAQAEADKRVSEGERHNRERYDELYTQEVKALEASFAADVSAARDDYRRQLDAYRDSLKTAPLDRGAFSALAEKFLLAKDA